MRYCERVCQENRIGRLGILFLITIGMQRSIATSAVMEIVVLKRGKGAAQGLGFGVLSGAVVGIGKD